MADARVALLDAKIARKPGRIPLAIFLAVLLGGVAYTGISLLSDLSPLRSTPAFEFLLLGLTLAIALGFEFVKGFYDTANAVATACDSDPQTLNSGGCAQSDRDMSRSVEGIAPG